jgi:hypothetical protein
MLWTVFAIVLILWLLGWGFHIAGSLIHLLLVVALVVFLIEIITGRRATGLSTRFRHRGRQWYRLCRSLAGVFFSQRSSGPQVSGQFRSKPAARIPNTAHWWRPQFGLQHKRGRASGYRSNWSFLSASVICRFAPAAWSSLASSICDSTDLLSQPLAMP